MNLTLLFIGITIWIFGGIINKYVDYFTNSFEKYFNYDHEKTFRVVTMTYVLLLLSGCLSVFIWFLTQILYVAIKMSCI